MEFFCLVNIMDKTDLFIIHAGALPDVIVRTLEAKDALSRGLCKTAGEAATRAGISRSAFYKYRDMVFPFYESSRGRTVTLALNLENRRGVLSSVLNLVADHGANILTINQNIPLNNAANVTLTIETAGADGGLQPLTDALTLVSGVLSVKVIARE